MGYIGNLNFSGDGNFNLYRSSGSYIGKLNGQPFDNSQPPNYYPGNSFYQPSYLSNNNWQGSSNKWFPQPNQNHSPWFGQQQAYQNNWGFQPQQNSQDYYSQLINNFVQVLNSFTSYFSRA